jgi:retinol dehydrogenase-12
MAPKGGILLDQCCSDMYSTMTLTRYGQAKLANILFTHELAKRYPAIRSIAIHPGAVNSGLSRGLSASWPWITIPVALLSKVFTVTVEQGAMNQLWAATSRDAKSGTYYVPVAKESKGSAYANDGDLQENLWTWTEHELDKYLSKNPV